MRTLPLLLLSACLVPSSWLESIELAASIHEETDPRSVDPDAFTLGHPNPVVNPPVGEDPADTAEPATPDEPPVPVDADGDGVLSDVDCDDDDAEVFPGAVELCGNGRDDDCDPTPYTCSLGPSVLDAAAEWKVLGLYHGAATGSQMLAGEDLSGDDLPDLVVTGGCPTDSRGDPTCGGLVYVLDLAGRSPGYSDIESIYHARFHRGDVVGTGPALAFSRHGGTTRLHVADPSAPWGTGGVVQSLDAPVWSGARPLVDQGTWVEGGATDQRLVAKVAALPGQRGDTLFSIRHDHDTGYFQLVYALPGASRVGGWPLTQPSEDLQTVAGAQTPSSDEVVDVTAGRNVIGSPDPDFAVAALDEAGGAAFHTWAHAPTGATLDMGDASIRATWTLAAGELDDMPLVYMVPDVTGDGRDDLVAASPCGDTFCPGGGSVWVVPGGELVVGQQADLATVGTSRPGLHLRGSQSRAALGVAVGTADLNGDGQADLVIGAPGERGFTGAVYVLYGPVPTGSFATSQVGGDLLGSRIEGTELSARFGASLHGAGDLDGDGAEELAVGAPRAAGITGAYAVGRIFVLAGGAE